MGVYYKQAFSVLVGKSPTITNGPIREKDFEIPPHEIIEITDLGENTGHRFKIPTATIDKSLMAGSTVALGEVLIIRTDSEGLTLDIKIVNANGTTINIPLIPQRTSVIHSVFSDILVSNTSGSDIEGVFFVVGN